MIQPMTASAESLNCPMCGAAASSEANRCEHCGARLATVACPSCFGMMFVGAKFCSHCGARADRIERPGDAPCLCPRCRAPLNGVVIGNASLRECALCEGLWADAVSLQQICADREKQAAVLGMPAPVPDPVGRLETVRYVPCPVCQKLMNRVNFAGCSNVVLDVCRQHGTWFDRDELRRVVEFIRAGGLDQARAKELARLEEERARLKAARNTAATDAGYQASPRYGRYDGFDLALSTLGNALKTFLKGGRPRGRVEDAAGG